MLDSRRLPVLGLVLAVLVSLPGCDLLMPQEETVTLELSVPAFTFEFNPSNWSSRQGQTIVSTNKPQVNLSSFLSENGFALEDVRSINPRTAELQMDFPIEGNLDFLERAVVEVTTSDRSDLQVASQTSFPSQRRSASLSVNGSANLQNYVSSPLQGKLTMDVNPSAQDASYTFKVVLTLQVEVGGFRILPDRQHRVRPIEQREG